MTEPKSAKKGSGAADIAARIMDGSAPHGVDHYVRELSQGSKRGAVVAARVVDEVVERKPALMAPHIAKLVRLLDSSEPRVVQGCANSLPKLAKLAPAKVARHLPLLLESYPRVSDVAKDGIMRTFVTLCLASIAYQRKLIDHLEHALDEAQEDALARWTELLLPALKGEPHARAREVVEKRLPSLSPTPAQKIADFLGIRLRLSRAP